MDYFLRFCYSSIPNSEEIATELGLMYLDVNDTKRAFQQFGSVLAQSPNYVKAMVPLAYVIQVEL
jgi:Tfp pilus assembly protein PilF